MSKKIKLFPRDLVALQQVKLLIEQSMNDMPSIKQLCKKAGLNEDKLKKGFKILFDKPPYAYHVSLKMEQAKKLLRETDMTIYEIAWSVGYEHCSNFCIEFKKHEGYAPRDFRRREGS